MAINLLNCISRVCNESRCNEKLSAKFEKHVRTIRRPVGGWRSLSEFHSGLISLPWRNESRWPVDLAVPLDRERALGTERWACRWTTSRRAGCRSFLTVREFCYFFLLFITLSKTSFSMMRALGFFQVAVSSRKWKRFARQCCELLSGNTWEVPALINHGSLPNYCWIFWLFRMYRHVDGFPLLIRQTSWLWVFF